VKLSVGRMGMECWVVASRFHRGWRSSIPRQEYAKDSPVFCCAFDRNGPTMRLRHANDECQPNSPSSLHSRFRACGSMMVAEDGAEVLWRNHVSRVLDRDLDGFGGCCDFNPDRRKDR